MIVSPERRSHAREAASYLILRIPDLKESGRTRTFTHPVVLQPQMVERRGHRRNGVPAEEILVRNGSTVIAVAPHAGDIEANTGKQAVRLAHHLPHTTTVWVFKGEAGPTGSAFDTWHVSSTAITSRHDQFALLNRIWNQTFPVGVAFHGWSNDGILVGGQHTPEGKHRVAEALRQVLPNSIPVDMATDPGEYAGMHDQNIVNRLSTVSIQLEQSSAVRDRHWRAVTTTLGRVLTRP